MNPAAWKAWSEGAAPELRLLFDNGTLEAMKVARRKYPNDCGPGHPQYQDLRHECTCQLDILAESIQGEYDDA